MHNEKILFIGGGNMASAIVAGLVANGYPGNCISVVDRNLDKRVSLIDQYEVEASERINKNLVNSHDVIILSVKPQTSDALCKELGVMLNNNSTLFLSVMAGLPIETIETWLGKEVPCIRAMPNMSSQCKLGATGLYKNARVTQKQHQLAELIMNAVGLTAWVEDESLIDVVTALSGSGPAYFFYFIEKMQEAAIDMGLPPILAKSFSIQTALGASTLAANSKEELETLRKSVTSKGGTTAAALEVFQAQLPKIISDAMKAARDRGAELGQQAKANL